MKSKLFWRLFWAFLAVLLLTVMLMSSLMVVMTNAEKQRALENEVRLQARDVAWLLQRFRYVSFGRSDLTLETTLGWKLAEIQSNYGAVVWLVNGNGKQVHSLGGQEITEDQINDPLVVAQLNLVLSGEEIIVRGLIEQLGDGIVTIGVPWLNIYGQVNGAVLMHISVESLQVDYRDILRYALIAAGVSMLIGTALAYWLSKRQTTPLRVINQAVTQFAQGQLDERVIIKGNDEMSQLAQSFNKMAEDLSNLEVSRRSFVASVSHELRSPLTCISGYVQGMMDGTIPVEEYQKYLLVVRTESARLTKLVNELLDLSKFESGDFPLSMSRFDINELVRVELIKFEQRIEEKRLDVDVVFKEQQYYVLADADRIRQVLTNLIDNAVKFAPEGGALKLSTHAVEGKCYVSLHNSGDGIAQEDLPFIFDRFYKADKAHTAGMGTGLGLSIVKRILEQHGQTITAQSGGGATFSFTLALSKALPENA